MLPSPNTSGPRKPKTGMGGVCRAEHIKPMTSWTQATSSTDSGEVSAGVKKTYMFNVSSATVLTKVTPSATRYTWLINSVETK